jgi:hypothetical protein
MRLEKEQIVYLPIKMDNPLACVMCGELAYYFAPDTGEPLCNDCCRNNEEARSKK